VCVPRRRSRSSLDNRRNAKQLFLLPTRAIEIERVRVALGAKRAQGAYRRRRGPIRTNASWVRVSNVTSRPRAGSVCGTLLAPVQVPSFGAAVHHFSLAKLLG
jgi:hypothetical protein